MMGGKSSRDKGGRGERFVVNAFKPYFPETKRHLAQTRDGGYDLIAGPYIIEVKFGKKPPIKPAWEQLCKAKAKYEADGNAPKTAVVVAKEDYKDAMAYLRFDDFLLLVEAAYGRRDEGHT